MLTARLDATANIGEVNIRVMSNRHEWAIVRNRPVDLAIAIAEQKYIGLSIGLGYTDRYWTLVVCRGEQSQSTDSSRHPPLHLTTAVPCPRTGALTLADLEARESIGQLSGAVRQIAIAITDPPTSWTASSSLPGTFCRGKVARLKPLFPGT